MKAINLKNTIGKGFLVVSLLFGIGVATSVSTQAQWRNDDQYRRSREYEREQRRRQREYERQQRREQRRAQRNDGYYGNNGGYNNDGSYNNGGYNNDGYNNGGYYGNGDRRNDGYVNYGGSFDLRQTALNAGANEGVKEGRRDRERGERFNYQDEDSFRNASKDYSSRLGDRYIYQRYFRDAFINGYTEGYRGY